MTQKRCVNWFTTQLSYYFFYFIDNITGSVLPSTNFAKFSLQNLIDISKSFFLYFWQLDGVHLAIEMNFTHLLLFYVLVFGSSSFFFFLSNKTKVLTQKPCLKNAEEIDTS